MTTYPGTRIGDPTGRTAPKPGPAPADDTEFDASEYAGTAVLLRPLGYTRRRYAGSKSASGKVSVVADIVLLDGDGEGKILLAVPLSSPAIRDALESVLSDGEADTLAGVISEDGTTIARLSKGLVSRAVSRANKLGWNEPYEPAKRLAETIRRERTLRGIKQAELGAPLGLDQTQVSQIESGRRGVSAIEAQAIAKVFGVELSVLLP